MVAEQLALTAISRAAEAEAEAEADAEADAEAESGQQSSQFADHRHVNYAKDFRLPTHLTSPPLPTPSHWPVASPAGSLDQPDQVDQPLLLL